ncbi:hypothetical protein NM208_g2718 [Fusarium decemcellulare]|uniref:Uncharacterized protein n=1 Tax=Fusarium decemcellulare TaxID=57161 RepID=A0ACC1SS42_9HYPO|nr:hypothetical protein NM208_g2718 [Fusarium decemcellulare]
MARFPPPPGMEYIQLPPEEVRICLAEDNRVNQKLMSKMLERFCYTNLHIFENGKDALEGVLHQAAAGLPYHLVLMDIQMPVMDGLQASRLIREHPDPAVRHVPIVALCASSLPNVEQFQAIGIQDFLNKPIQQRHIIEKVEKHGNPPLIPPPFFFKLWRLEGWIKIVTMALLRYVVVAAILGCKANAGPCHPHSSRLSTSESSVSVDQSTSTTLSSISTLDTTASIATTSSESISGTTTSSVVLSVDTTSTETTLGSTTLSSTESGSSAPSETTNTDSSTLDSTSANSILTKTETSSLTSESATSSTASQTTSSGGLSSLTTSETTSSHGETSTEPTATETTTTSAAPTETIAPINYIVNGAFDLADSDGTYTGDPWIFGENFALWMDPAHARSGRNYGGLAFPLSGSAAAAYAFRQPLTGLDSSKRYVYTYHYAFSEDAQTVADIAPLRFYSLVGQGNAIEYYLSGAIQPANQWVERKTVFGATPTKVFDFVQTRVLGPGMLSGHIYFDDISLFEYDPPCTLVSPAPDGKWCGRRGSVYAPNHPDLLVGVVDDIAVEDCAERCHLATTCKCIGYTGQLNTGRCFMYNVPKEDILFRDNGGGQAVYEPECWTFK